MKDRQIMTRKMNPILFPFIAFLLVVITSCRSDSDELTGSFVNEGSIKVDSRIANFIERTVVVDGAFDDFIDNTNCYRIKFPFTVTINTQESTFSSDQELQVLKDNFNTSSTVVISFPITVLDTNFSETIINDLNQLNVLANNCVANEEAIPCIDFEYPFSASFYDALRELVAETTFEDDKSLSQFFKNLDKEDIVNLNFPITVFISDGAVLRVSSLGELENTYDDVLRNRCNKSSGAANEEDGSSAD